MAIRNSLIVVIQNEPRDGDIVYVEKDEEAFKNRVVELDMVEADVADEIVELGQMYYDDDNACTIVGYEVKFPYPIDDVCLDCFQSEDSGYQIHKVGESMVVNFVEKTDCENCKEEEE
jgi:hypothetical protein